MNDLFCDPVIFGDRIAWGVRQFSGVLGNVRAVPMNGPILALYDVVNSGKRFLYETSGAFAPLPNRFVILAKRPISPHRNSFYATHNLEMLSLPCNLRALSIEWQCNEYFIA